MVALHPDPGIGERLAPVFLDVAPAPTEVHLLPINGQPAAHLVIQAHHPVVAFHHGREGIPAHDAGREEHHRPGFQPAETQLPLHPALRRGNVQDNALAGEAVRSHCDVQMLRVGAERFQRIAVIGAAPGCAVQCLDEGMGCSGLIAEEDAGDDRVGAPPAGIHELEIPSLEEGRLLASPVVELWAPYLQQSVHVRVCASVCAIR